MNNSNIDWETYFLHPIRSYNLETKIPKDILFKLLEEKKIQRMPVDTILVCPECEGLFTIRPGCPECGDGLITKDRIIHHFQCGNIDYFENSYDKENGVVFCSKCHKTNLNIGVDYDINPGICRCHSCDWFGNSPKLIGDCNECSTRFLIDETKKLVLYEYKRQ